MSQIKPRFDIISETQTILNTQLIQRFGKIEYVKPIAIATLLDPRFKNLHFNDPVACSGAMTELRKLTKMDVSSSESEGESSTNKSADLNLFDFWSHHKILAHGQKYKKNFYIHK